MSEPARTGALVVSPHFDDAVLSCWSVLDGEGDVLVVNVFTGGPAPGVLTKWDEASGATDSATRMLERHEEDRAALAVTGRTAVNLGLLESAYGGGEVREDALRAFLLAVEVVYAPAGVAANPDWTHPDHVTVRDAVLAIRPDARLYADQPYCGFAASFELQEELSSGLTALSVSLPPPARERKAQALSCYAGELPKLERVFGSFATPDRLRHELYWAPARSTTRSKTLS